MKPRLDRATRVIPRLYGRALTLYPAEFREEYAAEMVEFFGEDCRRAALRRGWSGLVLQSLLTLADLACSAPRVHLEIAFQDLRFAVRMLVREPGFALAAILTLALGIGANSTIFTLVHRILLTPLAFPEPGRLVLLFEKSPRGLDRASVSPPDFLDYRSRAASITSLAAYYEDGANLTAPGEPEHLTASFVTPAFFDVLLGSGPQPGPSSVVLSHAFWQRRFHGDPAIIGRRLRLDGRDCTVGAVLPESFHFGSRDTALWLLMPDAYMASPRAARFLSVIARLRPGTGLSQARAEFDALAASLAGAYPASNRGWGAALVPLQEQTVGDVRRALLVLMGAVGFILLIACANIGNLLLARTARRQSEIGIRLSLGACPIRIVRQLLTESVLIAFLGASAGLGLSFSALQLLRLLRPAALPRLDDVAIDARVIAFTLALALFAGVAGTLAPVLRLSHGDLRSAIQGRRLRGALIVVEVALSVVLLIGAGLLIRTFVHLRGLDPGFNPANATAFTIDLPRAGRAAFLESAVTRLQSPPGAAAGMISTLPLSGGEGYNRFGFTIDPREPVNGDNHRFYARWITPGYFAGMAIPLLQGRDFTARDRAGAPPVVIIDSALARRYFLNENPIGRFLRLSYDRGTPREVVGVAGEVRLVAMDREPAPQIYIPMFQEPQASSASLVVRGAPPQAVIAELRRLDAVLPVYDIRPVTDLVSADIAPRRFNMLLLGLLAALALVLAATGVYGVVSCMAGERRGEIGIRMALGARPPEILLLVLRQGMAHVLAGIVLGTAAAFLLSGALTGLLFGVQPIDPPTFLAVALLTAIAASLACLAPALRASSLDPAQILKDSRA